MNVMPSEKRPARVLALCEADIPSAVLGVHAVFETLSQKTRLCELRTGTSISAEPADIAWADSIVLVRGASPAERRILLEARRLGKRVATYLDDDLEQVPPASRSGYFFTSEEVRKNLAFIIREADDVLVCSDRLGDQLRERHGRRAVRILQPRPPRLPGETMPRTPSSPVRIGFLGSVDHGPFLDELLGEVLLDLQSTRGQEIAFVFCGPEPKVAAALGAEQHPFESDFSLWRQRALDLKLSIGLAPLPESPFHRFKYWNKYLEYGSLGIAGIYSDVPPHADVVRNGETGILQANEPAAWRSSIERLLDEPSLRLQLAKAAYLDVEARFGGSALVPHWKTALGPLLDHRAPACESQQVELRRGPFWHAIDRLAVYGPARFAERVLGRLTGRLRPG